MHTFFDTVINPRAASKVHVSEGPGSEEMRQMLGSGALLEQCKKDAYKGPICPTCHLEVSPAEVKKRFQNKWEEFLLIGKAVVHTECP